MSLSVDELVETGSSCVVGDAACISVFWRCLYSTRDRVSRQQLSYDRPIPGVPGQAFSR